MRKPIEHPLEKIFDMEDGTMDISSDYAVTEQSNLLPAENAPVEKDQEDIEVDKKIDSVYDAAMNAFHVQTSYVEIVEPRYAARNAEVAANYLNIALNAAATRAKVKTDRRRANTVLPSAGGNKTTNNLIVADRNELLKIIQVDGEDKELI